MIYYYTNSPENYLKGTWTEYPSDYPEIQKHRESFQFNTHFRPTTEVPAGNFVYLFDLRHRLVAKPENLEKFLIPSEIENPIKEGRCKILLWGWMENWSNLEFWIIVNKLKQKYEYLTHKNFIFVTASLEDFSSQPYWNFYANKMEWQWHEVSYKHVERLSHDHRYQPYFHFLCLNRRPAWYRFLTVIKLYDHKSFGEMTHIAPTSRYDDFYFGSNTAENKYVTEFELFKEKELIAINASKGGLQWPPEEDFNSGIENLWDESTDPHKYKNWWNGRHEGEGYWYWHRPSTNERWRFKNKEDAEAFRIEKLKPVKVKEVTHGVLARKWIKKVEPMLPMVIKDDKHDVNAGDNPNKDVDAGKYLRSYLHVVTETRVERSPDDIDVGQNLFASEKVFKPMFYRRPFVVVGQQGLLKKLKEQGYKTFPNMINDAYDSKGDDYNRVLDAVMQVDRWVKMGKEQKDLLWNETKTTCQQNFDLLMRRGKQLEKNMHDNIERCFTNVR